LRTHAGTIERAAAIHDPRHMACHDQTRNDTMSTTTRRNPNRRVRALAAVLGLTLLATACATDADTTAELAMSDGEAATTSDTDPGSLDSTAPDGGGAGDATTGDGPTGDDNSTTDDTRTTDDDNDDRDTATPIEDLLADGDSVELAETILLPGPAGTVVDAPGIEVTMDSEGRAIAVAPAVGQISFPTVGILADATVSRTLGGIVGTATGAELTDLDAHLRDDVVYWYVILDEATTISTGLDASTLPSVFEVPGGNRGIVVIDPLDPYVYVGFPCPGETTAPATVDVSISDYKGGCGFGVSATSRIPVDLTLANSIDERFAGLEADWVIDGESPVSPNLNVVGSTYVDLRDEGRDGFAVVAEGEFSIGISFRGGDLPFDIPIGRATVGYDNSIVAEDVWFSGYLGDDIVAGGDVSFVTDFLSGEGDLEIDGRLRLDYASDGSVSVSDDSFLQAEGRAALGFGRFAADSGVEFVAQQSADFFARIDNTGFVGNGTLAASPIPGVDFGGEASIAVDIPFDDITDGFVEIEGRFRVGGIDLDAGGRLRIDRAGVTVSARLTSPAGGFELTGEIGPGGVQLTGEANIVIPIGDLDKVAEQFARDAGLAETVRRLEDRVDRAIDGIATTDPDRAARLRNLVRDFRNARAEIDKIQDTIDYNDGLIEENWNLLAQAGRDWEAYSDFERVFYAIPHGAYTASLHTAISALQLANTTQSVFMDAALLTLTGLESGLIELTGTDPELRAAQALVLELRAKNAVDGVIATVLNGVDAVLDVFGIDGSLTGRVRVSVGTEGFDAELDLSWCRDGDCETIVGGSLTFPDFRACATVIGIEACIAL
jgi:hypothetical protein